MTIELLLALIRISWIVGLVILLVLLTRTTLCRLFGAQLAYLVWIAVPAALLAAVLPIPNASMPMLEVVAPVHSLAAQSAAFLPLGASHWDEWMAWVWATGAVAMLALFWRDHSRYKKGLGVLSPANGLLYCADNSKGPAVIGLWRHAIVVPSDFSTRYSAQERRLILAHEQVHAARRDPVLNALCALIQCALWFHPLVHLGARRYRLDQELACDAAVMQSHPGLRRSYADAMLKAQLSSQPSLINCHWQSIHPLKERIMHLKQTPPRPVRRFAGRLAVAVLVGACGYGAMAAHAGAAPEVLEGQYEIAMLMTSGGETSSPRVRVRANEPFAVSTNGANGSWRGEFVLRKVNAESVFMESVFKRDDRVVGKPNIMVTLGTQAGVGIDGDTEADAFKLQLTVVAMP